MQTSAKNKQENSGFSVREVGRVKSVRKFIAMVTDLHSCINGQIVEFEKGTKGFVMGFTEKEAQVLVLGHAEQIRAGDEVYNRGESFDLAVGKSFLGRTVNAFCEPIDGLGDIIPDGRRPVFCDAPGLLDREPLNQALETGTFAIDAGIPIAKGQRQLLIGDRGTGKTTIALDAILNQKGKKTICIYCCIGKPFTSLMRVIDTLHEKESMEYTIVVNGAASTSPGEQYIAPYSACMLGEYFMYAGYDVLVVFDDLTKHAWVYRQISLLLERPPGREAYPGDIFYIHSQLVERAAKLIPDAGGGSMSFLPIVDVLQGDVTGYVPTNLISMTDGQIYFSTNLFNKGFKPPVDFGLSVSRIGNKGQWPAMKESSKSLRLAYLQYQELLQMTLLKSGGLSADSTQKLRRGEALVQLLMQDKNKPILTEVQIFFLIFFNAGLLDGVPVELIKKMKGEILGFLSKKCPEAVTGLQTTQKLTDEHKNQLLAAFKDYLEQAKK